MLSDLSSHTPVGGYAEIQTQVVWLKNLCSFLTNQSIILPHADTHYKGTKQERTLLGHLKRPLTQGWSTEAVKDEETSLTMGSEEQNPCLKGHHDRMTKVMQTSSATATGYAFEASMNLSA